MNEYTITYFNATGSMNKTVVSGVDAQTVTEAFEIAHPGAVVMMVSTYTTV